MGNNIDYYPHSNFINQGLICENINIYRELLDGFDDHEIIAHIVNYNGSIKRLIKTEVEFLVRFLVLEILNKIDYSNQNQLKIFGIVKSSKESLITILASSFLGAHHSICFEELSESAIATRIELFEPDIIICRDFLKLKIENTLQTFKFNKIPLISFLIEKLEKNVDTSDLNKLQSKIYKDNDSLFTLYTSGSTGKPKAIVHSARKFIEYAKFTTSYFFGVQEGSIMFTATDAGWINGHTYSIYGPLACKGQIIICENLQKILEPDYIIQLINKLKITCLYLSVTSLRILRSNSKNIKFEEFENNKLDRIGSCGEPLAHEIGLWAMKFFRPQRKNIVNTFFQTETGGILVAPRDEDGITNNYSSVGVPRKELGLFLAHQRFSQDEIEEEGLNPDEILVEKSWDGLFQKVKSDRKVNYFTKQGYFRLNDVGYFDKDGFLYVGGRSDDVLNIAGHRISTSEIESICLKLNKVKEACVVAIPDKVLGQKPLLFLTLNESLENEFENIKFSIRKIIDMELSKYHQPEDIFLFDNLPKTRSGKIMRRIMRDLSVNLVIEKNKDYSTLINLNEYLKSEEILQNKLIDYSTINGLLFNLNKFLNNSYLNRTPSKNLFFFLFLIIENILRQDNKQLSKILIRLESNINQIIFLDYKYKERDSLLDHYKKISESNLKRESCMQNLNSLIIRFVRYNNSSFTLIFKKIDQSLFKVNFAGDKNRDDFIICKNSLIKLLQLENYSEKNIINQNHQSEVIDKENNDFIKEKKITCIKCLSTINEIKNDRGPKSFFFNIVSADGEKKFMCDLCMRGW